MKYATLLLFLAACISCSSERTQSAVHSNNESATTQQPKPPTTPTVEGTIVKTFPHDTMAFTQGLTVNGGRLIETTGQYGVSELREVDLASGKVLRSTRLGGQYFGEGSTVIDDNVFVITWLNQEAFVYGMKSFSKTKTFNYFGEGWGLTTNGRELFMSNGSEVITVRNATDFSVERTISVRLDGQPCRYLNELEWVEDEIWANVWQTDMVVCINPQTGTVNKVINLAAIYPYSSRSERADVLNGIAYDQQTKAVYVTGKNWPHLYQIRVQ